MPRYATVRIDLDLEETEKFQDYAERVGDIYFHGQMPMAYLQELCLWSIRHNGTNELINPISKYSIIKAMPWTQSQTEGHAYDIVLCMIESGFITVENDKWRINVWEVLRIDADKPDDIGPAPSSKNSTEANQASETGILADQRHQACYEYVKPVDETSSKNKVSQPASPGLYPQYNGYTFSIDLPGSKAYVLDISCMDGEEVKRMSNGSKDFINKYLVQGSSSSNVVMSLKKS